MKFLSVAAGVFALSASLLAQGPPAKGGAAKSAITVSVGALGCTTSLGTDVFPVLSWSWGASNPVDLSGSGGGGAGKVSLSDLNVMKPFDACSPALFGAVATGKAFPNLTLTASNKDGTTTTLTLSDVHVSSWQASGSAASDAAAESVAFTFSKICLADGGSGARFCYDAKSGKTF
jgi:type VI protein secretion system component Hcp